MLTITILDGEAPIAVAEIAPDLDENGEDTGQHSPLVEFRVLRYQLLPGFENLRSTLRAAGEATIAIGRRRPPPTESERDVLKGAMQAGKVVEDRLLIHDQSGLPMNGRITLFRETDFGADPLHAIGIALPEQYVQASLRTQPNDR